MASYRKKPIVIEAVQWYGKYSYPGDEWPDWFRHQVNTMGQIGITGDNTLLIGTLEGEMRADIGDWVIKGVKGEFYPCKPDIFEATYEAV